MTARVSIVTRTKDRPVFLRRALASITGQSFEDWALIIVNDGGDPSEVAQIVDELPDQHHRRVTIIDHAAPLGRWEAANAGVRVADGEFLILHDDDDSWEPSFLDTAVDYLDRNPDREGVVSRIDIIWERRTGDALEVLGREPFLPDSVAPLLMNQQRFNQFVPIAFLYRRSLHDEIGLYDDSLPVVGDWVFNTRVLERGPLSYLPGPPLAHWHQRPSGIQADGNSVIAESDAHRLHDALVRDAAFRRLVATEGSAGPLYFEARLRDTEEMLRRELASMRHDLAHPLLLVYRRLREAIHRFRGTRRDKLR
ncbi:glycosyltransferase family 2 protein [Microbacterium soli]|uniref:Glycosyltransferase 2-like domain-containing protein n=1 Tax=Microbacterium soli TaxID=446075 RepID=A0ABP7MRT1_9MICO